MLLDGSQQAYLYLYLAAKKSKGLGLMPIQKMTPRKLPLVLWGCCCLLASSSSLVMGEVSSLPSYGILETKYIILNYRSWEDLEDFEDAIDYSGGVFSKVFSSSDGDDLQENVKNEVDALYRRVQEILKMRKKMKKVTIKILRNREEIKSAYRYIYRAGRRTSTKKVPRAWFRHKNNEIYINLDDLDEGMLAHEMAHSIIDNDLLINPPRTTPEILAQYVDRHLFD
jgi:hypothetical protein